MSDIAIVRASDGVVLSILRGDGPPISAPDGCRCVPAADLPTGWVRAEALPPPVPEEITPWQLRTWLLQSRGISPSAVLDLLAAIPDAMAREQALIDWDYPSTIRRNHPLVGRLGAAVGLDAQAIDQAFREAASL